MVKIVETVASSVTSTKQHIWCGSIRCEERDGSGNPSKQFFSRGQINSSTNYFYGKDHLGSIRSMTDGSGNVQAAYSFDPFGRTKKLEGAQDSDFQFAGYYLHPRSGLNLTFARAYHAILGRFVNRDPVAEDGGINLFEYVRNNPVRYHDPRGTYAIWCPIPRKDSDPPEPYFGPPTSGVPTVRVLAQVTDDPFQSQESPYSDEALPPFTPEEYGNARWEESTDETGDMAHHSYDDPNYDPFHDPLKDDPDGLRMNGPTTGPFEQNEVQPVFPEPPPSIFEMYTPVT